MYLYIVVMANVNNFFDGNHIHNYQRTPESSITWEDSKKKSKAYKNNQDAIRARNDNAKKLAIEKKHKLKNDAAGIFTGNVQKYKIKKNLDNFVPGATLGIGTVIQNYSNEDFDLICRSGNNLNYMMQPSQYPKGGDKVVFLNTTSDERQVCYKLQYIKDLINHQKELDNTTITNPFTQKELSTDDKIILGILPKPPKKPTPEQIAEEQQKKKEEQQKKKEEQQKKYKKDKEIKRVLKAKRGNPKISKSYTESGKSAKSKSWKDMALGAINDIYLGGKAMIMDARSGRKAKYEEDDNYIPKKL